MLLADGPACLQRNDVFDWFGGKDEYLKLHLDWVSDARSKWFAVDDID